jgi:regulator of RNase E activity RraA
MRDKIPKNDERKERAGRTNVTRLDYLNDGSVVSERYNNPASLKTALTGGNLEKDADKRGLRLFVVEDLSRDVIEPRETS